MRSYINIKSITKKLFISTAICTQIFGNIFAYTPKEWNLPGVDIIKRADWITDQSIIFKKSTTTTTTDNEDDTTTTTPTKGSIISSHLTTTFPTQVLLDGIIRDVNGQSLIRARGYKTTKSHIVVHHTAADFSNLKTPEDARVTANAIFKYHTQTKGRGDIGYNFIIDPWGNIYEGRGGGEGVVGAHAAYNNASSLGIALMGNFEINEPTQAQLNALTKLSTALTIRYRINPDSEVYSHIIDNDHEPYIKDITTKSFIGHRDTGVTACPGKNLYNKLPLITQAIRTQLLIQKKSFFLKKVKTIYQYDPKIILDKDTKTITIPLQITNNILRCSSENRNIKISCKKTTNGTNITFQKRQKNTSASGIAYINLTTNKSDEKYKIITNLERDSDKQLLLTQRRETYIKANNITPSKNIENKFKKDISLQEIKELATKNIDVLLYEASTTLSEWKFLCQQCTVTDDKGLRYNDNWFTIQNNGTSLTYTSKNQTTTMKSISIQPNSSDGTSFITNYDRKSFAGIARNNFYGTINISQQAIKKIGADTTTYQYVLTNNLPFDLYMRGIVESNDTEPTEKIKVMTLLAKNYILFYLDPTHRHPSVPQGVSYNAIDDARIFQKYVGAGIDDTLKLWKPALETTKNQIVTYNNNLAFLSYFSCSAGFTRSAKEKRGLQDTPYLVSVYDPAPCKDFNGHGVGLAGNGATALAKDGKTYEEIIKYFYPGVSIQTY